MWNRTEAKARALETFGAKVAATPGDAVAGADRVHMTLPDDEVVDQIVAAFTPRAAEGAIVIDHTTASPRGDQGARREAERRRRQVPARAGVHVAADGARTASASCWCRGRTAVYDAVREPLEEMTGEVWYIGE